MLDLPSAPARVALVRLSHLGDCARALPLFCALRERWPRARLAWAIEPAFASLVEGLPGLDEVLPFERRGGWRAWPRLRARARAFGAELAIDAQGNAKSAAVTRLTGAPLRVGWHPADWRERPFARLGLNRCAPPAPAAALHASAKVEHLIRFLGAEPPPPARVAALFSGRLDAGRATLDRLGPAFAQRPVLLQLPPAGDPRSFSDSQARAFCTALLDAGRAVALLAGPAELEAAARLAAAPGDPRLALVEPAPFHRLAGLFLAASEREGTFLGSDSGPAHLAACVGLPCVTLHGPFDPARTGLWPRPGPDNRHVELQRIEPLDCRPCARRTCRRPGGNACLTDITPDQVLAALEG